MAKKATIKDIRRSAIKNIQRLNQQPEIRHDLTQCPFCGASPQIEFWHGGGPALPNNPVLPKKSRDCPKSPTVLSRLRQGGAAVAMAVMIFLIPIVECLGASRFDPVPINEHLRAEAACVGLSKKVVVFDIPKEIEIFGDRALESDRGWNGLSLSRPQRAASKSLASVFIDCPFAERLYRGRYLSINNVYGSGCATIVLEHDLNSDIAGIRFDRRNFGGPEDIGPFRIADGSLPAANSEPAYNDKAGREENQGDIGKFSFFTKSRPAQVFAVAGLGSVTLIIGFLLVGHYAGVRYFVGFIMIFIGALIAVYGPLILPREFAQ